MIYIGIDDTDVIDHPGTNQLARQIARNVAADYRCHLIVRHQLLVDPRVPCTNKNGCAAMLIEPLGHNTAAELISRLRKEIIDWAPEGSDPGLCVATETPPPEIVDWGRRCKRELLTQDEAHAIAKKHGAHLEGLGGTNGGVIGALAAIGLVSTGNDGRVVYAGQTGVDELFDFGGRQDVAAILSRGVHEIHHIDGRTFVTTGSVELGKRLRPNYRAGKIVLFVAPNTEPNGPDPAEWEAIRAP